MFSKQTLSYIPDFLPETHTEMKIFLQRYDLDDRIELKLGKITIPNIKIAVMDYLTNNPESVDSFGKNICISVMEDNISKLIRRRQFDEDNQEFKEPFNGLYRLLRLDGYDIDLETNKLISIFPEDIGIKEKDDLIQRFLIEYGFDTTKTHYDNAKSGFLHNDLASFNGQLRTFTESLFLEMAKYIKDKESNNPDILNINPDSVTTAMQIFAKCQNPILLKSLNEWMGNGNSYFDAYWKRLHPQGSHAGIPTLDETVYRYQLVLLNNHLIIKRFMENYK